MSRVSTRSRGQAAKPVVINLRKTDWGYALEQPEHASGTSISISKNLITKQEPRSKQHMTKGDTSVNKISITPPAINQAELKKQLPPRIPISQKGLQPATNSNIQLPSPKTVVSNVKPELEPKRREIFPFTSLVNQPPAPAEGMQGTRDHRSYEDMKVPTNFDVLARNKEGAELDPITTKIAEGQSKKFPVVLPSCAHWFDMNEIHQIEKDSLPEFFCGKPSKTPQVFKRYRNYMVQLYRQSPKTHLNSTMCRRNLAGDACAIMRIHGFLEHWGIINFNIDPANYKHNLLASRPNGTAKNVLQLIKHDEGRIDFFDQESKLYGKAGENELLLNQIKMVTKSLRPVCDFCGLICGVVWFQQQSPSANQKKGAEEATELPQNVVKGGTLVLCVKCYADGNIPNILSTQDFTKIDLITKLNSSSSRPVKGQNNWSQEETLRLLDLISKFNDDWNEIQRHYPSRTKEDLILHFLQMPAKNVTSISLMEANDQIDDKRTTEKTTDPNISCLSDYSNPLLQHVAVFKSLLERVKAKKAQQSGNANSEITTRKETDSAKREEELQAAENLNSSLNGKPDNGVTEQLNTDAQELRSKVDHSNQEGTTQAVSKTSESQIDVETDKNAEGKAIDPANKESRSKKDLPSHLIDIQLRKLDSKIQFLEEYEKAIWNEKKQLEILHKLQVADRVMIAIKRNEVYKNHHNLQFSQPQAQTQTQHNQNGSDQASFPDGIHHNNISHQQPHHQNMLRREDKADVLAGSGPSSNVNQSIDDMLNFNGMDEIDEDDYDKGDQL